jgi:hypothetical protein
MSRFQLIKAARERVVAVKLEHQHRQIRKGQRLPNTVTVLTRRAS